MNQNVADCANLLVVDDERNPSEARILAAITETEEIRRHYAAGQLDGSAEELWIRADSTRYDPDVIDSLLRVIK